MTQFRARRSQSSLPVSNGIIAPIQYLRVVAAIAVLFYHVSASIKSTWAEAHLTVDAVGAAGVDLFFVISGFIMAKIVADSSNFRVGDFLYRRGLRVVPLYWLVTFFVFGLAFAMPSLFNKAPVDFQRLLHSLLFLPFEAGGKSVPPVVLVGWSLNYEMFFYALVAVCAGLMGDGKLVLVRIILLALVLTGVVFDPNSNFARFYTDPILLEFLFGITVYSLWERTPDRAGQRLYPLLLLAGIVLLLFQLEKDAGELRFLYWGFPAAMIVIGALHSIRFQSRVLLAMADWSYAIYLTHIFVVLAFVKIIIPKVAFLDMHWSLHYGLIVAAALILSALVHHLVEIPATRIVKRMLGAGSPQAATALLPRKAGT